MSSLGGSFFVDSLLVWVAKRFSQSYWLSGCTILEIFCTLSLSLSLFMDGFSLFRRVRVIVCSSEMYFYRAFPCPSFFLFPFFFSLKKLILFLNIYEHGWLYFSSIGAKNPKLYILWGIPLFFWVLMKNFYWWILAIVKSIFLLLTVIFQHLLFSGFLNFFC